MARDNVTFKFRIDLTQMTVKGRQAVKILEDIERKSGKAAAGMSRMGTAASKTGQQTAAAAINFQTATQGMLNLSTAAVQTFTSISNLDRANNRAKMSVIAVARAEDLLANKIERQNTLRAAGQLGSQKDINITKEIATAKADLTVKTEKMGIEQAAVNDIYMLFATNIANVTISSIQTIAILDKNQIILNGLKAAGMKLNNLLSINAARAAYSEAAASAVNSTAKGVAIGVTAKLTVAMYGLAAATRAVVAANPLLMVAMAGLTVAWAVHETDILGTKTALDGYIGVEKDHLELMEAERLAANALSQANGDLTQSYKKLSPVAEAHYKMLRDFMVNTGNARLAAQYEAKLMGASPQGFSQPSGTGGQIGTSGGGISETGISETGTASSVATTPTQVSSGGFLPMSYGDTGSSGIESSVVTPASITSDKTKADPFGSVLQQELYKGLNPIQKRTTNIILAAEAAVAGRPGAAAAYLLRADQITAAANSYVEPKHFTFADILKDPSMTSDNFFGAKMAKPRPGLRPELNEFKFGIDIASREGIDPKSTRGKVLNKTGRDIGTIGQFIDVNEGIRLANLQTTMSGFSNTKGGKSALLAEALALGGSDHGGLSKGTTDMLSGFGAVARNKAYNIALGNGQLSATAAYQVPKGSVRASAGFYQRLAIKDDNTNRLRTGGVLREGMEIDEQGAVTGGFTSLSAFRADSKIQYFKKTQQSLNYVGLFGGGVQSRPGGLGKSGILREYSRINDQASSYRDILSRAGLGLKSNIPSFGRALSYSQHQTRRAELISILSYNNNQLAKAEQINILSGGYDLGAFRGSSLSAPALSDKVLEQDMLMKSIGLDRTEAFQIIDTFSRGREEIDDRIRWKDRINNISTGTTVL
tara:strand:+ start:912 stop:3548 length:2637 start_codon:yes stop_codon:yes gene_type:complete